MRPILAARGLLVVAMAAAMLGGLTEAAGARPVKFTLSVSPNEGTQTDTYVATVHIEVAGITGVDRYWDPVTPEFTVVNSQIQQQTTSMMFDPVLGQQLKTTEIRRYYLEPKRAGRLVIEPAKIRLDGKEYETRRAFVRVRAGGGVAPTRSSAPDPTAAGGVGAPGFQRPRPPADHPEMFLHVVVDELTPYVGEQVVVTWMLYTRGEVFKFEPRPPRLDGLWSEKLYEPDAYFRYHDDVIGGVPYQVAIVSKRAVFPTQAGKVVIKAYMAKVSSLFAPTGESQDVASEPIVLEVKSLPDGAPPGFDSTYVGDFAIDAQVDRVDIDAGQSMTLTLTVRGEGAIRRTTPPNLQTGGFRFRAPRDFDERIDTTADRVGGERVYRYWATPQHGGKQTIPPLHIPYFNPRAERYEIARTEPIEIMVRGDPTQLGDDPEEDRNNFIAPDIRLIIEGDTISSVTAARLHRAVWYWLLAALPGLVFLSIMISDRVRRNLNKDTPRSRLRRARGRARKRLRVADIHLRGDRPAKFFAELAKLIYDHVEERVGQPVQAMTLDELRGFLADKGFTSATISRVDEELQNCDFARFAPAASGPAEMKAALLRTRELLHDIEKTHLGGLQ